MTTQVHVKVKVTSKKPNDETVEWMEMDGVIRYSPISMLLFISQIRNLLDKTFVVVCFEFKWRAKKKKKNILFLYILLLYLVI